MSEYILQISAGQGPLECQYFVPLLAEIIAKDAAAQGLECLLLSNDEQKKVYRSSMRYLLRGTLLEEFRSQWCGTVQWIWQSTIRPHHLRKNWFVKVSFSEFAENSAVQIKPEDLRIESFRSSGNGGQHVNTTDSAVRITHLPTGLKASASEERSQIRNKALAMLRLQDLLENSAQQAAAAGKAALRMEHYWLERGRPVKIFTGVPPREKR